MSVNRKLRQWLNHSIHSSLVDGYVEQISNFFIISVGIRSSHRTVYLKKEVLKNLLLGSFFIQFLLLHIQRMLYHLVPLLELKIRTPWMKHTHFSMGRNERNYREGGLQAARPCILHLYTNYPKCYVLKENTLELVILLEREMQKWSKSTACACHRKCKALYLKFHRFSTSQTFSLFSRKVSLETTSSLPNELAVEWPSTVSKLNSRD